MCSIFAGFGNIFNEINMTALVPLFTVTFLCNYVYLITYEACRSWKFSFENCVCHFFIWTELPFSKLPVSWTLFQNNQWWICEWAHKIMKYVKKGKKLVLKTKHRKHPPKHQWNWEKCSKSTFHLPEIITLASIRIKMSFNQNLLSQTICTTVVVSDWCITNLAYCWWFSIQSIVGIERRRN